MTTQEILKKAKAASKLLPSFTAQDKDRALEAMADALLAQKAAVLSANAADLQRSAGHISEVMLDRLRLNDSRIEAMAEGVRALTALPDPVGQVLENHVREDGLSITRLSCALGVIAIIYESRPNVTSDAAALALKSGNACILRCGKEAHESALAITSALKAGLRSAGFPEDAIMLVEDTSRESASELMTARDYVDLLIPRGGKGLIDACVRQATVPCIQTGTGICHIYIDRAADLDKALNILENAKTSRPSVCNAAEVCLIDRPLVPVFIPLLEKRLKQGPHPVALRLDPLCLSYASSAADASCASVTAAGEADFDTEFLDYILAVAAVDGVNGAIEHIDKHSTHHSEAIVTEDPAAAAAFTAAVDSAAVYVNASTRFTDGGEFGLGCEMGISTQKLHARGPMGLRELTTYKYIVTGNGHIR